MSHRTPHADLRRGGTRFEDGEWVTYHGSRAVPPAAASRPDRPSPNGGAR
jgi:hypothetical protein